MLDKIKYFIFLIMVGAMIYFITAAVPIADIVEIEAKSGTASFENANLKAYIANVSKWDSYPDKLYYPADFAAGTEGAPVIFSDELEQSSQFGTHRILLALPVGETYGITFRSIDYATRVFIDGKEISNTGTVGASAETTEPRTDRLYFYTTPKNDKTEIILQYANFVHNEGGRPPALSIGSVENIMRMIKADIFSNTILAGVLFAAFLYHLGVFILYRKKREFLYFALTCLLFALRANLIAAMFFPNYNWHAAIKVEYIVVFTAAMFLALLFQRLYPRYMNKKVLWSVAALLCTYNLLIAFTSPMFFSQLLIFFQLLCAAALVYVIVNLGIMASKAPKIQNVLAFTGAFIFMTTAVSDILALNNLPNLGSNNLMPTGAVIFMLVYMISLSTETAEREKELEISRLRTENQLSLQMNRYEQIVENIEKARQARHDLRHHLSVISAYAENDNHENLKKYLADYLGGLPESEEPPFCQNHAVDAVLRHYLSRARAAGAEINVRINLPQRVGIPNSDLCIVFGNIFENAAKAMERQTVGRKYIKAICESDDGKIVLTVDNSTNIGEKPRNGLGLKSVEAVTKKSDGGVLFEQGSGVYQSSIMLYPGNLSS